MYLFHANRFLGVLSHPFSKRILVSRSSIVREVERLLQDAKFERGEMSEKNDGLITRTGPVFGISFQRAILYGGREPYSFGAIKNY